MQKSEMAGPRMVGEYQVHAPLGDGGQSQYSLSFI